MSAERNQHDKHDDALNKVLGALRYAAPPKAWKSASSNSCSTAQPQQR